MIDPAVLAIEAFAADRAGLFTYAEAVAFGIRRDTIHWHTRSGRWRRVAPRVYAVVAVVAPGWQPVAAELLRAANSAVATGVGAGRLLGLDAVPDAVEISVGPGKSRARPGVRRRTIDIADTEMVHGFRCLRPLPTLVELASTMEDDAWECALESAVRRNLVKPAQLLDAEARGRARDRILRVVDRRGTDVKPTRSILETRTIQLIRSVDVPDPVRGYEIIDDGRFVAEVDLSWPWLGGYLECDGRAYHLPEQFEKDRWRDSDIAALLGWPKLPVTWRHVHNHPRTTAQRIERFVATLARRVNSQSVQSG